MQPEWQVMMTFPTTHLLQYEQKFRFNVVRLSPPKSDSKSSPKERKKMFSQKLWLIEEVRRSVLVWKIFFTLSDVWDDTAITLVDVFENRKKNKQKKNCGKGGKGKDKNCERVEETSPFLSASLHRLIRKGDSLSPAGLCRFWW